MGIMQSVPALHHRVSSPNYPEHLGVKPMVTIHESSMTVIEENTCNVDCHTNFQTAEVTTNEKVSIRQIMKKAKKRKLKRIGMSGKHSPQLSLANLFDTYEEALQSGSPDEIEQAFYKLPFRNLKTSQQKVSAWKLLDLKGERKDLHFLQRMMKYVVRPKIAEDGVFDDLLTKLRNESDDEMKEEILKEMSSRPVIDFTEIFEMHGVWQLETQCFVCHKLFKDKNCCMVHASRDHKREEILEHFKQELDGCKQKINSGVESANNESSESFLDGEVSIKSENQDESEETNNNLKYSSSSSLIDVEGSSPVKEENSEPSYFENSNNKNEGARLSFLNQPSLSERDADSGSNSTMNDSAATRYFSLSRMTSSTHYRDSTTNSTMEVTSTDNSDLTILVTHKNHPHSKLSERDFLSFQNTIILEVRNCEQWPRLESSTFRSSDGAFVLIAVDQNSKDWFCHKIQQESLWDVPFKIQKVTIAAVTVPLFGGVKNSEEILKDLKVYNPSLMTENWLVLEEREDVINICLKFQLSEVAIESLAALDYKPYYHFGRLVFRIADD